MSCSFQSVDLQCDVEAQCEFTTLDMTLSQDNADNENTLQGKFLLENVSEGIIMGNQTLVIQNVDRKESGLYTCIASNAVGDGESNAISLDVKCEAMKNCNFSLLIILTFAHVPDSPFCADQSENVFGVEMGGSVKVSCQVTV